MDTSSSSTGVTKSRKSSHTLKWTIENFGDRYVSMPNECGASLIVGPTFQVPHPDGVSLISWTPELKLDDKNEILGAFLGLKHCPGEYLQNGLLCSFQFCIDYQGHRSPTGATCYNLAQFVHDMKASYCYKETCSHGWNEFLAVKDLMECKMMKNDSLELRIELTMYTDDVESSITSIEVSTGSAVSPILEPKMSLESMLGAEELSDIKVECGNEIFAAHKAILAGRSKVFKAMLTSEMDEVISGRIKIADMTPTTFQLVLRHIYTGGVDTDIDSEDLLELTYGAEKYGLEELKEYCFAKLIVCVTDENVAPLAVAAYLYGASASVKNALKKFMEPKFLALMKKDDFRKMVEKNPGAFF